MQSVDNRMRNYFYVMGYGRWRSARRNMYNSVSNTVLEVAVQRRQKVLFCPVPIFRLRSDSDFQYIFFKYFQRGVYQGLFIRRNCATAGYVLLFLKAAGTSTSHPVRHEGQFSMRLFFIYLGMVTKTVSYGCGRGGDVLFTVLRPSVAHPLGVIRTGSRIPESFQRFTSEAVDRTRISSASMALSSILVLPTLDGVNNKDSSTSRRSRRGKYPVVELWRRPTLSSDLLGNSGAGCDTEDDSATLGGRHRRAEGEQTALEHLRNVLGLGSEQTDAVQEAFPALAQVDHDRLDVHAKLRFVRHTMGGDPAIVAVSYPQFFGHPLERHIAPRHAFLVESGRPSGAKLLKNDCRGLRRMLELPANRFVAEMVPGREMLDYRRFETGFLRGPFDAARKGDANTLWLLRSHGWYCWETDRRGRTALFWAAGAGSLEACSALADGVEGLRPRAPAADGSTPLHWAATGVEAGRFGTGGHVDVCRWLVSRGADPHATTSEGNTVLMWAAWAGDVDVTRWAVEEARADLDDVNANGCSVAHWAASGGDEAVCRYLLSKGADFTRKNRGGNDPLNHAVAYGRRRVVAWLLGEGASAQAVVSGRRRDDPALLDLARLTGDAEMQEFLRGAI